MALGSALGGAGRYWCSALVASRIGVTFPWGTMTVNVLGSFAIGLFAVLGGPDSRWLGLPEVRQFVMLGVLGGFTTFSTFSLQTLVLIREGDWLAAAGNAIGSVVACMVGVWLGHVLGIAINR